MSSERVERAIATLLVITLAVLAGCASGHDRAKSASVVPPPFTATPGHQNGTAATFTVQIDGTTRAFNATFAAFFPDSLQVHPGDTIVFYSVFHGSPHTVMLGTLIDRGLADYENAVEQDSPAGPNADVGGQGPPNAMGGGYGETSVDDHTIPALAAIPDLKSKHGDFNQAVAQPCFLDSGRPPGPGPMRCPRTAQPPFTGRQSFYSSGWLGNGDTFTVRLADSIRPDTYHFMCAMHRTDMVGSFTVLPGSEPAAPRVDFADKLAAMQSAGMVEGLIPTVNAPSPKGTRIVRAGVTTPNVDGPLATVFQPTTITIPVGGTVTWKLAGPHDIAFNPPADATPDVLRRTDGSVHANPLAWDPVAVPPPTDIPRPRRSIEAITWDGHGFLNTGVLETPTTIQVTFTARGTYHYFCLIHVGMTGTVIVR